MEYVLYFVLFMVGYLVIYVLVVTMRQEVSERYTEEGKKQKAANLIMIEEIKAARTAQEQEVKDLLDKGEFNAKRIVELKYSTSACPKCAGKEHYLQPVTIVRPAGLGSTTEQFNVPFCRNCDVEFVPRFRM